MIDLPATDAEPVPEPCAERRSATAGPHEPSPRSSSRARPSPTKLLVGALAVLGGLLALAGGLICLAFTTFGLGFANCDWKMGAAYDASTLHPWEVSTPFVCWVIATAPWFVVAYLARRRRLLRAVSRVLLVGYTVLFSAVFLWLYVPPMLDPQHWQSVC